MRKYLAKNKCLVFVFGMLMIGSNLFAQTQLPECQSSVPFFVLDLTNDPDSIYVTPEIVRTGQCCNDGSAQNYVSFYVTLHPDVAMVEIGILPGYADPGGSGFYNIISGGDLLIPGACGADIAGGQPACITGVGPHKITYHKPGSNKVKYYLKQIPRPIFPIDQSTRVGCTLPLHIFGLNSITITSINSSTGNTTPGAYNTLLSCTNCANPVFQPGLTTPAWIDYQICGTPQASACGTYPSCDTVRLYTYGALGINANDDEFCAGGGGVTLTAFASGGDGNYNYIWKNSLGDTVSTSASYLATSEGQYTAEVTDGLTTSTCPPEFITVSVTEGIPPVMNAGVDQVVCASDPQIFLQGTAQNATGGIWTGGTGTYNPNNTTLLTTYTPSAAEIAAGSVTLTLTSTGTGGGCANSSDDITIIISPFINGNPTGSPIGCYGGSTTLNANASGGTPPYTYLWSTGATTASTSVSAGTYSLIVGDQYGCEDISFVTINEPNPIILTMSSNNTSTDIACDGSASVTISGGTAPYTVLWSNGQTTLSTTNTLCYGIVTVTVTDANGCQMVGSTVVNNPSCSAFNVTATNTNLDCHGDMDGTAQSFPVGGNSPYSYSWNTVPPQLTQNASGLGAGTYTVTVTDNVGCVDVASVTVLQPSAITNTMTHTDVTSLGGSDGTATANPTGGTPGYTYLWTPTNQTSQTAVNLTSAVGGVVYYVDITDNNSCTISDSVLINQTPCDNFIIAVNPSGVSCNGYNDGSAYIVIGDGTAPYNIVWSHGPTNVTSVSGLSAGNYSVTVTDFLNCTTFQTYTITEPDDLTLGLVPTNISCFGANDGTIDLTVSGGTFPYTYNWTTGAVPYATHEDLSFLKPGTYSITVTDANGCTVSGSIGVIQPASVKGTTTSIDDICNGDSNGSIDVTPEGGIVPYSYSWTGPSGYSATTQDISGLSFGLYTLQITDANGCTFGLQEFINQPDTVLINSISVPCPAAGVPNVIVTVSSITGGAGGPYQISFNNGVSYQAAGNYSASLAVGASYNVLARDANGCTSPFPFVLTINPNVSISNISFNPCIPNGATTIPVTVTPAGGNGGPYQVSTNGGSTWNTAGTYTISVSVGASYSIVIRDGSGCLSLPSSIVIANDLVANAVMTAQVGCFGQNNGAINLTVSGGTTSYTYAWTGPSGFTATTEDLTNLAAGTYNVTVTDALGCTETASVNVTTTNDVTDPVISCAGNQSVNTSSSSCTYTQSGTAWNATATDNCVVASVTYVLTGATTGSGFNLNGVSFNLGVTTVTWTATDGLGNTDVCSYTVTVTDATLPAIVNCGAAGNQTVTANTGVCTYTQSGTAWNATATDNCTVGSLTYALTGATTGTGTSLNGVVFNPGTTTVTWTVSDNAGNSSSCSFTVTVTDSEAPAIVGCPTNITVGSDNGVCGANVTWTVPTFMDNCGATMSSTFSSGAFFNVGTTTVTYTVTDGAGNITTCSFTVTVNDDEAPAINCPATIASCDSLISFSAPTASDNCGVQSIVQIGGLPSGSIFPVGTTTNTFEATDIHGNTSTCSFLVIVHPTPTISVQATNVQCNGNADGIIDITVANGTEPYVYDWSNSTVTEDQIGLGPDTYLVVVTDANLCSANVSIDITQPEVLSLTSQDDHVNCFNGNDGAIDIEVSGGTFPYIYAWSNGQSTQDVGSLNFGDYDVTVTDFNGCITTYATSLSQPDSLMIQAVVYDATCNAPNGSIQVLVTGGTTNYTYSWSDGSSGQNLNNTPAGDYTLICTDAQNCIVQYDGTINSVSNLEATTFFTDVMCYGDSNGAVQVYVENGNAPYTYSWSNGETTNFIDSLPAGPYDVDIVDAFGCSTTLHVDISQPDSLYVSLITSTYPGGTNVGTYGGSDGYVLSEVIGGTPVYTYTWSNGASTEGITNIPEGNYTLICTDQNGCVAYATSRLVGPAMLEMPSGFSPNGDESNETFVVHGIEAYPINEISVYNRWGNIVYKFDNYSNEWAGDNTSGEPLPDATYFVILTVFPSDGESITLKGYVDLRR